MMYNPNGADRVLKIDFESYSCLKRTISEIIFNFYMIRVSLYSPY